MRIGNGPRLAIPRPNITGRRGWYGRWMDRGQAYDEWRAMERERLREIGRRQYPFGDHKRISFSFEGALILSRTRGAAFWRRVDANGRTYGPRFQPSDDMRGITRVRYVERQEEDLRSLMSRMMARAHRASA